MSSKSKAPTMKDVAREAGVALGTVSKVFNGIPVGELYKNKVLEASNRLGYQVNEYARGLRAQKTGSVAVIVPNLTHPFYSSLADNCCDFLQKRGYRMLVSTTSYNPETEQQCIDMVQQNKVDGIIAITYNPNIEVSDNLPFVIIDRSFGNSIPCISSDNFSGGILAAEKLIENGCTNLLFLGNSSSVPGEADKRVMGFESYCKKNNIQYQVFNSIDDELAETIFDFVKKRIVDNKFEFDGIFCNTDTLACQIHDILLSYNINVPGNVQIIGYDGITRYGSEQYYCSTIRQPLREMAKTAVDLLLDPNMKDNSPSLICLPVTYCYGGTTKS